MAVWLAEPEEEGRVELSDARGRAALVHPV